MILSFQEIFLIDQERKKFGKKYFFFHFIYPDFSGVIKQKSKLKRDWENYHFVNIPSISFSISSDISLIPFRPSIIFTKSLSSNNFKKFLYALSNLFFSS